VNYQGTLAVRLTNSFSPSLGDSWALIQSGGTITFSGLTSLPTLAGGLSWDVQVVSGSSEFGASGSSLVVSVVPAPSAAALVGLAGLVTTRRRRA
jgi:MYXO-CTERM domain-containing protein